MNFKWSHVVNEKSMADKMNIARIKNEKINPLTPELNPSAQRCMTTFLLGILLLEPCISLIYARKTKKCNN
jgi:hypothetical protein